MNKHEPFIRQAYQLAKEAVAHGNHPFGALLVQESEVILTAENTIYTDHDVTRHAELNLVSLASQQFDAAALAQCTLYTSTEPCAVCRGHLLGGHSYGGIWLFGRCPQPAHRWWLIGNPMPGDS